MDSNPILLNQNIRDNQGNCCVKNSCRRMLLHQLTHIYIPRAQDITGAPLMFVVENTNLDQLYRAGGMSNKSVGRACGVGKMYFTSTHTHDISWFSALPSSLGLFKSCPDFVDHLFSEAPPPPPLQKHSRPQCLSIPESLKSWALGTTPPPSA